VVAENATTDDLLINHIEVAGLYHGCRARHKAVVDAVVNQK
jgi:hypothetical protein